MELFHTHNQWANRPADERFSSLEELYSVTKTYADSAVEKEGVPYSTLRAEASGNDVVLVGKGGAPAALTNWSFGQLCQRAESPASYLRGLPATLASQCINNRLKALYPASAVSPSDETASLMFHKNGSIVCRSITSDKYRRIWNYEVAERLLDLQQQGWYPAKSTFRTFDPNEKPALYASDHDMFAMVMMPNVTINQPVKSALGESAPLYRGLIYSNSEVGAASLTAISFWFNQMCGNHVIWVASNVIELNARHVGTIHERVQSWNLAIRRYAASSAAADQAGIDKAANMQIAGTKEELLNVLFGRRNLGLSRKAIAGAYDACLPEVDGSPLTVWGFVQGATRYSQQTKYQDERIQLDRAAAKVLSMAF